MSLSLDLVKGSTPMMMLSLLAERPMYGYQVAKAIQERTSGALAFKEGTLYPILHALERDGSVEGGWEISPRGRRRKYYHLTAKGRRLLSRRAAEWREFSAAMEAVLGSAG